ncbi:hypothetical protein ACTA71_012493 [Dictyostelium dimigraforme]
MEYIETFTSNSRNGNLPPVFQNVCSKIQHHAYLYQQIYVGQFNSVISIINYKNSSQSSTIKTHQHQREEGLNKVIEETTLSDLLNQLIKLKKLKKLKLKRLKSGSSSSSNSSNPVSSCLGGSTNSSSSSNSISSSGSSLIGPSIIW